ncbi:hypothetical protein BH23ACT7_BH23ACT7_27230 [soil metagenome]
MFKRAFFGMVGLGAGVALGVYAVRKVEAAQRRLTPEALAASAGSRVGGARARIAEAVAAGREAAAGKEAELRAVHRVRQAPSPRPAPES